MANYAFVYKVDGECKLYAESSFEEDKLDIDEDGSRHIEMTGNGYMAFYERCMMMVRDYKRIARAYEGNELVSDGKMAEFRLGKEEGTIEDLYSGMEKTVC